MSSMHCSLEAFKFCSEILHSMLLQRDSLPTPVYPPSSPAAPGAPQSVSLIHSENQPSRSNAFHSIEELIKPDSNCPSLTNDSEPSAVPAAANKSRSRKRKKCQMGASKNLSGPTPEKRAKAVDGTAKPRQAKEPALLPPDLSNCLPSGSSSYLDGVSVEMDGEWLNLWKEFDRVRTEMIVTRAGRRFYPVIKIRLENCDPSLFYYVLLDVVPVDGCRYQYRYSKSKWKNSGKADPPPPYRLFMHPDSPFNGQARSYTVQFDKAKLTNFSRIDDQACTKNHIVLNSMHKYQVRIHVLALDHRHPFIDNFTSSDMRQFFMRCGNRYRTFEFPYTKFFAVTAYQNGLVKNLKIQHNPFAKGFRDKETNSKDDARGCGESGMTQPKMNGVHPSVHTNHFTQMANASLRLQHFLRPGGMASQLNC